MWDERRPRHFTLSYARFLYSPDVFHNEFVIILSVGLRSSRRWKMRVFIADDSRVIVERLADLLKEVSGVRLVGNAGDVSEALRSIPKANPDVVILDLQMPGGSGLVR